MAETSAAVIASANNLCVKYGAQVVLDGATIAFTEGEHVGLVGRNGSGKPPAEIFDLETQLKTARDKIADLYARWRELELLQSAGLQ